MSLDKVARAVSKWMRKRQVKCRKAAIKSADRVINHVIGFGPSVACRVLSRIEKKNANARYILPSVSVSEPVLLEQEQYDEYVAQSTPDIDDIEEQLNHVMENYAHEIHA